MSWTDLPKRQHNLSADKSPCWKNIQIYSEVISPASILFDPAQNLKTFFEGGHGQRQRVVWSFWVLTPILTAHFCIEKNSEASPTDSWRLKASFSCSIQNFCVCPRDIKCWFWKWIQCFEDIHFVLQQLVRTQIAVFTKKLQQHSSCKTSLCWSFGTSICQKNWW